MFDGLAQQVGMVTGGSRGIGRAMALRLAADGMTVAIVARSDDDMDRTRELARSSGGTIECVRADVAEPESIGGAVHQVWDQHGRLDLIINNAGTIDPDRAPLSKASAGDWWRVIEVNLRGAMLVMNAAIPLMLTQGEGRIVNVTSLHAITGAPGLSAYGASKAALIQLSRTADEELQGTGVRVFNISPGRVRTDMNPQRTDARTSGQSMDGWTPVEKVEHLVTEITRGNLDDLSGRFLHAEDDLRSLLRHTSEMREEGGRTLSVIKGYADDGIDELISRMRK